MTPIRIVHEIGINMDDWQSRTGPWMRLSAIYLLLDPNWFKTKCKPKPEAESGPQASEVQTTGRTEL